jgi:hypothetical protein
MKKTACVIAFVFVLNLERSSAGFARLCADEEDCRPSATSAAAPHPAPHDIPLRQSAVAVNVAAVTTGTTHPATTTETTATTSVLKAAQETTTITRQRKSLVRLRQTLQEILMSHENEYSRDAAAAAAAATTAAAAATAAPAAAPAGDSRDEGRGWLATRLAWLSGVVENLARLTGGLLLVAAVVRAAVSSPRVGTPHPRHMLVVAEAHIRPKRLLVQGEPAHHQQRLNTATSLHNRFNTVVKLNMPSSPPSTYSAAFPAATSLHGTPFPLSPPMATLHGTSLPLSPMDAILHDRVNDRDTRMPGITAHGRCSERQSTGSAGPPSPKISAASTRCRGHVLSPTMSPTPSPSPSSSPSSSPARERKASVSFSRASKKGCCDAQQSCGAESSGVGAGGAGGGSGTKKASVLSRLLRPLPSSTPPCRRRHTVAGDENKRQRLLTVSST